ncbi:MAG: hypothetical protein ACI4LA_01060 [Emergencia sp.]
MKKRKIEYHYTNLIKQCMIGIIFVYALLYFAVILEILVFRIDGYYENINFVLTIPVYLLILAMIVCLFRSYKFCYSIYDPEKLTYHNSILRKSRTVKFADVRFAQFGRSGVKFFGSADADPSRDKPLFFLPFFRGGVIDPIQIDKLHKYLLTLDNVKVEKTYKILPGYARQWKILSVIYGILGFCFIIAGITPLTVVIILFQNH